MWHRLATPTALGQCDMKDGNSGKTGWSRMRVHSPKGVRPWGQPILSVKLNTELRNAFGDLQTPRSGIVGSNSRLIAQSSVDEGGA